ncbi:hypothetical protein L5515_001862 [Caenorhabditis briggsae]|uniref:Uncharacterized protein n=1 Tax=Caenorhabditis briggsae TaxID=6238 RepID=A0AAE9E3W1_CAEBR|nr:hypothetical protein L5515_001862 [Caenorhabditis briggsae]
MNLRERKFVDYVLTPPRILKSATSAAVPQEDVPLRQPSSRTIRSARRYSPSEGNFLPVRTLSGTGVPSQISVFKQPSCQRQSSSASLPLNSSSSQQPHRKGNGTPNVAPGNGANIPKLSCTRSLTSQKKSTESLLKPLKPIDGQCSRVSRPRCRSTNPQPTIVPRKASNASTAGSRNRNVLKSVVPAARSCRPRACSTASKTREPSSQRISPVVNRRPNSNSTRQLNQNGNGTPNIDPENGASIRRSSSLAAKKKSIEPLVKPLMPNVGRTRSAPRPRCRSTNLKPTSSAGNKNKNVLKTLIPTARSCKSEVLKATPVQQRVQNAPHQLKRVESHLNYDFEMESESKEKWDESSDDENESDDTTSDEDEDTTPKRSKKDYDPLSEINSSFQPLMPIKNTTTEPRKFKEMQELWSKLVNDIPEGMFPDYKLCLRDMLTGRVSSQNSVASLVPGLPARAVPTHNKLYVLLYEASGAHPCKYHEGTKLVSQHKLADTSQIGAQMLLECLDNGVVPFDPNAETRILKEIQTYVRIGIKDMLQDMVERLSKDRNIITADDLKETLVARLFDSNNLE